MVIVLPINCTHRLTQYEVLQEIVLHKYKHCIVIYISISITIHHPHHYFLNCREQNSEEFYKYKHTILSTLIQPILEEGMGYLLSVISGK